jgi:hypothetical protein
MRNILVPVFAAALGLASIAQAQPGIASGNRAILTIPPVKTSLDLDHQTVEISLWGTVSPTSPGIFALALTVDLGGLQTNLTPMLAAELNRSDRCGERLTVEKAVLAPAAPAGVLIANVNFERYACVKVLGKEIVKRLVGGHGVIEVNLTPSVDENDIMLTAEVRKIDADGTLGDLLRSGSLGDSLREKIGDSIEEAIQKSADLKLALPGVIEDAATIQMVQFADGGAGRLWLTIGGEVRLSAEQLRGVVGK